MYLMEREAIILQVIQLTSRGRIAHVSELTLTFMDLEIK